MAGKKKTKRVAKAMKRTTKTGKATKGVVGSFNLNIPGSLARKLEAKADADTGFKGKNPVRYAMNIIKNSVTQ